VLQHAPVQQAISDTTTTNCHVRDINDDDVGMDVDDNVMEENTAEQDESGLVDANQSYGKDSNDAREAVSFNPSSWPADFE
jgi:hypothetical protein